MDQADREPDADARDGAEDEGQEDEEAAEVAHERQQRGVVLTVRLALGQDEEQPAATAKWETNTCRIAITAISSPAEGISQMG